VGVIPLRDRKSHKKRMHTSVIIPVRTSLSNLIQRGFVGSCLNSAVYPSGGMNYFYYCGIVYFLASDIHPIVLSFPLAADYSQRLLLFSCTSFFLPFLFSPSYPLPRVINKLDVLFDRIQAVCDSRKSLKRP